MKKKYDVVALGELLMDFVPAGKSGAGMPLFEGNPGGAPANVLTLCSHLGLRTAFIGKVGDDLFGHFLREVLEEEKIETKGLLMDKECFTTMAFVSLAENGERSFSFARKPGADTQLRAEELEPEAVAELLQQCRILHVGSLSMTDEPARSATLRAIEMAKEAGALISYDPNYRAPLWKNKREAVAAMKSILPYVDLMKVSEEEAVLLTGRDDISEAVTDWIRSGISLIAITLGEKGSYIAWKDGVNIVHPYQASAVDTTGAGDAFWGGVLTELLRLGKPLEAYTVGDYRSLAAFGNAAASLCVEKHGAIPAMPYEKEIAERMTGS